jgi:RNA polymerase sigma factor (sigma-70 family)
MNEHELLAEYNRTHSAEIFRQIVDRYVDFVFATARRQLRDEHLAEDVTQAVFLLLAKKAGSVSTSRPILAWLHTATRYAAANAQRGKIVRQKHERIAAEMKMDANDANESHEQMSPLLDEGIARLRKSDRDAILLKFFERKSHREIAGAMGISEEAAAKRVSRAVERLREFFRHRGVTVTSTAIGTMLATEATRHAPSGLAQTLGSASTASTSAAAVAKGAVILMTAAKIKTAVVAVIFIIIVLAGGAMAVRSWNENHPVAIEQTSVEPSSTAWQVQFGNATIALAAIGDQENLGGAWWQADGSPAMTPPQMRGPMMIGNGGRQVRLVFLANGLKRIGLTDMGDTVSINLKGSRNNSSFLNESSNPMMANLVAEVPPQLTQGDVEIAFASGPWTKNVSYDIAAPAEQSSEDFQVVSVSGDAKETIVKGNMLPSANRDDYRVVVLTAQGKELMPNRAEGSPTGQTMYFPCPKDQAKQVIYHSRPYVKKEIQNVSLQAGTKTHPTVGDSTGTIL